VTAKSTSFKSAGCKLGGCGLEAVELTLGKSAACFGIGTEGGAILSDRAAEVSSGQSSSARDEGRNLRRDSRKARLMRGHAPANQPSG
jgi:hypothetical protein